MKRTIIALDTDHIKEYVFGTSALKEIRSAFQRSEDFTVTKPSPVRSAESDHQSMKIFLLILTKLPNFSVLV